MWIQKEGRGVSLYGNQCKTTIVSVNEDKWLRISVETGEEKPLLFNFKGIYQVATQDAIRKWSETKLQPNMLDYTITSAFVMCLASWAAT